MELKMSRKNGKSNFKEVNDLFKNIMKIRDEQK